MDKSKHKSTRLERRHGNIRKRIEGTGERPRLAVYKSLKHIHAQVIDDLAGKTLASASSVEEAAGAGTSGGKTGNRASAASVGKLLAQRASSAGVKQVVFDRGGFKYHGRVKALADAAREAGLTF
jgi:large subunit ribosomal protein L18